MPRERESGITAPSEAAGPGLRNPASIHVTRTALVFLAFGLSWIIASNFLLSVLGVTDVGELVIQLLKGGAFVVLAAFVIFLSMQLRSGADVYVAGADDTRTRFARKAATVYLALGVAAIPGGDVLLFAAELQQPGTLAWQLLAGGIFLGTSTALLYFLMARKPRAPVESIDRETGRRGEGFAGPWRRLPLQVTLVFSVTLLALSLLVDVYDVVVSGRHAADEFGIHLVESLLLVAFSGLTLYWLLRYFSSLALRAGLREAQSRERHESLFTDNPSGVCTVDRKGRFIDANQAFCGIFGQDLHQLIGTTWEPLVAPDELASISGKFQAALEGKAQHYEAAIRRPDGERRLLDVTNVPRHEDGQVTGVYAVVRDITVEQTAHERVAASEARFRALFENSLDAVFMTRPDGAIDAANPAAQAMLGMPEREIIERGRDGVVDMEDPALTDLLSERERTGRTRGIVRYKRADGSTFPAEITSARFDDVDGEPRSFVVAHDISERVRHETALTASEARHRAIFENSMDGMLLLTNDGAVLAANPAAKEIFGMDEAELRKLDRTDLTDPDDPAVRKSFEERKRTGRSHAVIRMVRAGGGTFTAEISAVQFESAEGEQLVTVVVRDVTEQRERAEQLEASEARYRELYNSHPDAVLEFDADGHVTQVNEAACELTGHEPGDLVGRRFDFLIHPESLDFSREQVRSVMRDGESHSFRVRALKSDGEAYWAQVIAVPRFEKGRLVGTASIVRDIDAEYRAQQELRDSEARYRVLYEQSPDAVFLVDAETGVNLDANGAAEQLFGMDRAELIGRIRMSDRDIDDPDFRAFIDKRRHEGRARGVLLLRRSDGSEFPADVISTLFRDRQGRNLAITTIRDVTEQEAYERRLAESEERFRVVADSTGQAIYEIDLATGTMVWAGACHQMFGVDADRLARMSAAERLAHVPEADRDRVAKRYRKAAQAGDSYRLEYRLDTVDGRHIEVEDWGVVLKDRGRMYGVIQDVTEKRRLVRDLEAREQALSEVSQVQQAILDALPAHIALLDQGGTVQYVNAAWRRFARDNDFLGSEDGVSSNYLAVCDQARGRDAGTAQATARGIRQVIEGLRGHFGIEYACHSPDKRRWFQLAVTPFRTGDRIGAVVAHVDVSDRREAERQLRLVAAAFRSADEAMLLCDSNFAILDVNNAYERITGRKRDDAIGNRPLFLEIEQQERNIRRALQADGQWRGELLQRRLDGKVFVSRAAVNEVPDPEAGRPYLVINFEDISELREYERKVDYLSYHDPLTGLPNRAALSEWFRSYESGATAGDNSRGLAFVFIDLDRLKSVNDAYGHGVGDELITELGKRLRTACKGDDYVARLIGDEFVMVISDVTDGARAMHVVRQRMKALAAPLKRGEFVVHPTVCAGISLLPQDGTSLEELLRKADVAMHEAKRQGRGELMLFSAEMTDEVEEQLVIERQLRSGIDNREFLLHYQPSVRLESGRVIGLEALVRWENPELGLVSPARFIPVAEDSGMIIDLGDWVFEEVCRQIREWRNDKVPFGWVAINLSPIQFQDPALLHKIRVAMERHEVSGSMIRVEITERVLVMDPDWTIRLLDRLRELGIKVAVDDFGTGYSSLAYLKRFPVDFVKLDKTFVSGLPDDEADASIVGSVIELARRLGMRVVAEGIERGDQLEFLKRAGCQEAQGYYFSLPLNKEDIPWLMNDHRTLPLKQTRAHAGNDKIPRDRGG